uniref:RNA-directed RNA polymerase catalytic subunit n=1 Tax=Dipteran orthomyxo-related virus OKIAV195 TaxID=2746275 RepID=A0A7D7IV95_9ORTO|nr:polymerase PB1 [Dipteran orthomyxo-related virus OKIAV195]
MMSNDPFDDIPNSLLDATFRLERKRNDIKLPENDFLNTLGTISCLYLYANPPPMAYGTPAPKIAETVLRANEFNTKKNNKTVQINKYKIDNPVWENEGLFPYDEVSSNWHPGEVHKMSKKFLSENYRQIYDTVNQTIENCLSSNSDVLTKGKQTWDPINERSVPSPQAYSEYCELLSNNGMPNHHTLIGLIKNTFLLMEKNSIVSKKSEIYYNKKEKRLDSQRILSVKKQQRIVGKQYENDDVIHHILDLIRSFCGYNKSGERAHLRRRAIASPSIPMRAFLFVIEEMHLLLGKRIKGSTISIGGDEKKMKIINTMASTGTEPGSFKTLQATQDATKWNECLSASGFCMFSKTLFNDEIRKELGLPLMNQNEKLFEKICEAGHFLLAIKRIALGDGLQGNYGCYHGEIEYKKENLLNFNKITQEWLTKALEIMEGNYLTASGGMLMGMHNALSTTFGLISVGYKLPNGTGIYTLRSSDDSMTLYSAPSKEKMESVIDQENLNLKACGINLSKKKTFIFKYGYGEFTSWYQDMKMVSQYGPETTTLRPGGNNPPDDFTTLARNTSMSLLKLETNEIGAEAKIRLGVNNIRSLYRIRENDRSNENIKYKCLLLPDGGPNPWNCSNCHLEESCIKETFIESEEERSYFLKIRNPDNPFSTEPKEETSWSRDEGTLTVEYVETPRTIFHFLKRSNRSIVNIKGPTHAESEKAHSEALNILTMADISTLVKIPSSSIKMSDHIISCIRTLASDVILNDDQKAEVLEAIGILKSGKVSIEEEESTQHMESIIEEM